MTISDPHSPSGSSPAAGQLTPEQWREQKTLNALHQADELARRQQRESDQAQTLLDGFVAKAKEKGLEPVRLYARSYNGTSRYKTSVFGWYLKMNESVAVDTEGRFYVLSVQGGLVQRFKGATVTPSAPPLVLGLGGRDGESLDMAEAIDRVLNPGNYR